MHFRYNPQGGEVIKGMSFEIQAGMVVGVVGRSGSGKSTISKLIQRLYIPEAGKISVDGMDISLVNPAMLRKQIGVVLQENFMFNGTVIKNKGLNGWAKSSTPAPDVLDTATVTITIGNDTYKGTLVKA